MLLARTAESAYWAGRYLERAEDMARIVAVHGETHLDLPVGEDVGWGPLLAIAGVEDAFDGGAGRDADADDGGDSHEARVVRFLLTDRDNPSSILSSLDSARTNLRHARPVVPREAWEVCNDLWLTLRPAPGGADPLDGAPRQERMWALRRVVAGCEHLNGVLWGAMRRDEALAFVRIGQQLERVDITARVLQVRAASLIPQGDGDPYDDVRRAAVLRSLAAHQPFRRAMPASSETGSMLRFVLHDDAFPRAVASCLGEVLDLAKGLPRNEPVVSAAGDAAMLVAEAGSERMTPEDLATFAARLQYALGTLHHDLCATFFRSAAGEAATLRGSRDRARPRGRSASAPTGADRINPAMSGHTYRIRHRTTYTYAAPVEQSYNEAHLRPRDTAGQHCLDHVIEVDPPQSSWSEHLDVFGNTVAGFVVRGGFEHLTITATSRVLVADGEAPAVPGGPPWETARRLIDADRLPASADARRFRTPSRLVPGSPALAEYAAASFPPGRALVEGTLDLSSRIHRDFLYDPGFTSVTTPLLEMFEARRGVCQDFAHLAVGCLRSLGLAARYVSGYLETRPPPGQERLVGADASHAWASVYIPGWGWLDIDPTNDQIARDSYVTVGWGRDYWDVSPLRGSVEGGGGSHTLEVEVDVDRLDAAKMRP